MGAPDLGKADFAALLELAESKFNRWLRKEVLPERDRRLLGLKSQRLMFGGRAFQMQRIYEEFLCREVRGHIGFYAEVAHDSGNPEMLSVQRLAERREHIMTSVGHACAALKDTIKRDARAEGNVSETQLQALLDEKLYEQLSGRILNVVNDEIGVLEAEGNLSAPRESKASGAPAVSDSPARVKPGPHRDTRTAHKVKEIVTQVANGERWQNHLDDILLALDEEEDKPGGSKVPTPKKWKKSWLEMRNNARDRDLAKKAIDHHLKNASLD